MECKNVDILKDCMGPILQRIQANAYANNPDQINDDLKTASADYNRKAKGENKGEILSEFITTMNPVILDIQKKKVEPEDNHMKDFEKQ